MKVAEQTIINSNVNPTKYLPLKAQDKFYEMD